MVGRSQNLALHHPSRPAVDIEPAVAALQLMCVTMGNMPSLVQARLR